jgi:uncharacterized protein (DUF1330 family)
MEGFSNTVDPACAFDQRDPGPSVSFARETKGMMKKGYWIVAYRSISDETALRAYAALALPAIAEHGGRALVRTSEVEPREAGIKQRTVVTEFESFAKAVETYESQAYQKALQALGSGAERDFRIVEGA